jgi:hypothetical protein
MNAMKGILAIALISGVLASAVPVRADEIIQGRVYLPEDGDGIIQAPVYIPEGDGDQLIGPQPYVPKPIDEGSIDPGSLMTLTRAWMELL